MEPKRNRGLDTLEADNVSLGDFNYLDGLQADFLCDEKSTLGQNTGAEESLDHLGEAVYDQLDQAFTFPSSSLFDTKPACTMSKCSGHDLDSKKDSSGACGGVKNLKSTRRQKKPKGEPKRPLSAYNLFFRDSRIELMKEKGGSVKFDELGKEVGRRWKALSEEDKKKWEEKAAEDSERYRREMEIHKTKSKKRVPPIDLEHKSTEDGAHEYESGRPRKRIVFRAETFHPVFENMTCAPARKPAPTIVWHGPPFRPPPACATMWPSYVATAARSNPQPMSKLPPIHSTSLPDGIPFPNGLPPSGSEVFWPDANGVMQPHTVVWKIYNMKTSDANVFIDEMKVQSPMDRQARSQAPSSNYAFLPSSTKPSFPTSPSRGHRGPFNVHESAW